MSKYEPTREELEAFIRRAGFTYGWENLESWARRMAEQGCLELHERESAKAHDLVKTGDADATPAICDCNGEVVLAYCRRCKKGEADLGDTCEFVKAAVTDEWVRRLSAPITPEELKRAWNMIGQAHPQKEWVERALIGFIEFRLAAIEAVAPMLASARVPDEKEDLDPVRLRREGRVATEWERGFNEGWNDCRDAMLAASPKPETEE